MTEREKLMLAVVEAARAYRQKKTGSFPLDAALRALNAHTPEPEGEMVTMGIIRSRFSGRYSGTMEPDDEDPRDWLHVANITFRAPPMPAIPTIPATVERKP